MLDNVFSYGLNICFTICLVQIIKTCVPHPARKTMFCRNTYYYIINSICDHFFRHNRNLLLFQLPQLLILLITAYFSSEPFQGKGIAKQLGKQPTGCVFDDRQRRCLSQSCIFHRRSFGLPETYTGFHAAYATNTQRFRCALIENHVAGGKETGIHVSSPIIWR